MIKRYNITLNKWEVGCWIGSRFYIRWLEDI